jgi:hypothetical protein
MHSDRDRRASSSLISKFDVLVGFTNYDRRGKGKLSIASDQPHARAVDIVAGAQSAGRILIRGRRRYSQCPRIGQTRGAIRVGGGTLWSGQR